MTPQDLETLHRAAFEDGRPWTADEFESLLRNQHTSVITEPFGFALIRMLAGETELLTLAVDPAHRRKGIARSLLNRWFDAVHDTATIAFLEVAADNQAARALYRSIGFEHIAARPAYYKRQGADPVDALILQYDLTRGQIPDSTVNPPESG